MKAIDIVKIAHPSYHGRKIRLSTTGAPSDLNSWWDGGSRDYYTFVRLSTRTAIAVHSNHPTFESDRPRALPDGRLPRDVALVKRSIFAGKEAGCTI